MEKYCDFASYSSIGKRKNNEDSWYADCEQDNVIAVVGDGVGGHSGGEKASALLTDLLPKLLKEQEFSQENLEDILFRVNEEVVNLSDGISTPMTTLALLWIHDGQAFSANLGDSRIYQFRDHEIVFQSEDHSVPQLAVAIGRITKEEIRSHPERNKITRCLGMNTFVSPNIDLLDVRAGDRFLLCSDGFWEPVRETDMINADRESDDVTVWLDRMRTVATALERDNHTAIAIQICDK